MKMQTPGPPLAVLIQQTWVRREYAPGSQTPPGETEAQRGKCSLERLPGGSSEKGEEGLDGGGALC